jgi:hypothetical protein
VVWFCRICIRIWSVVATVLMSKMPFNVMEPLLAFTEYMYCMPSVPLTCCSMGVATEASTVSASAPT